MASSSSTTGVVGRSPCSSGSFVYELPARCSSSPQRSSRIVVPDQAPGGRRLAGRRRRRCRSAFEPASDFIEQSRCGPLAADDATVPAAARGARGLLAGFAESATPRQRAVQGAQPVPRDCADGRGGGSPSRRVALPRAETAGRRCRVDAGPAGSLAYLARKGGDPTTTGRCDQRRARLAPSLRLQAPSGSPVAQSRIADERDRTPRSRIGHRERRPRSTATRSTATSFWRRTRRRPSVHCHSSAAIDAAGRFRRRRGRSSLRARAARSSRSPRRRARTRARDADNAPLRDRRPSREIALGGEQSPAARRGRRSVDALERLEQALRRELAR